MSSLLWAKIVSHLLLKIPLVFVFPAKRAKNRIFIFLKMWILGVFLKRLLFGRKYALILCAIVTTFVIAVYIF